MDGIGEPLAVRTHSADGAIYDYGAQAVSWIPRGLSEVLYLSSAAVLSPGTAIRGGIPVCFPWFGPGRSGSLVPAHGFARTTPWRRTHVDDDGESCLVVHEFDGAGGGGAIGAGAAVGAPGAVAASSLFPHPFHAVLRTRFGRTLESSLTIANTGQSSFSYEAALHTYLRVGDAERVVLRGLEGARYRDKTAGGIERRQEGPVLLRGETDRVYLSSGPVLLEDPVLARSLTVTTGGSAETVVWNPWSTGAARLADIGPDEWRSFVCIEGANVLESAVTLEPGASHTMQYGVSVTD